MGITSCLSNIIVNPTKDAFVFLRHLPLLLEEREAVLVSYLPVLQILQQIDPKCAREAARQPGIQPLIINGLYKCSQG